MSRLILPLSTLGLGSLLLVACATGGSDGTETDTGLSSEDTELAEALWTAIDGYQDWSQTVDWEGVQPSEDGTHGAYVQIWLDDLANGTVEAAAGSDMPGGAILVKEGYDDAEGATLKAITVMQKIDGYDADNGDWFYGRYDADGGILIAGQDAIDSCAGCHASGQDSVRYTTW